MSITLTQQEVSDPNYNTKKLLTNNRIGRIIVSKELLEDSDHRILALVYQKIIPVRVEYMCHTNSFEIFGYSADFKPVDLGLIPPLYNVLVTRTTNESNGDVTFTIELKGDN